MAWALAHLPPIVSKHSQPRLGECHRTSYPWQETTPEKDMDEVLVAFTLEEGIDEENDGRKKEYAKLL